MLGRVESDRSGVRNSAPNRLLTLVCALVLGGILIAGLWPFHAASNDVSWLSLQTSLFFGKHGSIISAGTFEASPLQADSPGSLEISLEPSRVDSGGTVLAFYRPTNRTVPFVLRQFVDGLLIQRKGQEPKSQTTSVYVDDVFSRLQPMLLTVSSGEQGTAIYVDGMLVKKARDFKFSSRDMNGQLIVGNAPSARNNWCGKLKGLTFYDRELPAAEVAQHFADWTKAKRPNLVKSEGVVASYLFNEGKGNVVHNQVDSATDLVIPERYFVLDQQLLVRPWKEFHSRWSYWVDVGINIAGFIPFGFCFRALFAKIEKVKRATAITIALGFVVSLTIEVLQAFLPTRDSGMTDLITNTFGTAMGAMLCTWILKSNSFERTGIFSVLPLNEEEEYLVP